MLTRRATTSSPGRALQWREALAEAFAIPDLDREVKWHAKYGRQNGIHVSPTFMIDGRVGADISSVDAVTVWVSRLLR